MFLVVSIHSPCLSSCHVFLCPWMLKNKKRLKKHIEGYHNIYNCSGFQHYCPYYNKKIVYLHLLFAHILKFWRFRIVSCLHIGFYSIHWLHATFLEIQSCLYYSSWQLTILCSTSLRLLTFDFLSIFFSCELKLQNII